MKNAADLASTHNRRARALGAAGRLSGAALVWRWFVWGGGCYVCRGAAVELDHVKPLAVGGPNVPANIRPICRACHRRKTRAGGAAWRHFAGLPFNRDHADRAEAERDALRARRVVVEEPDAAEVRRRAVAGLAVPYRRQG